MVGGKGMVGGPGMACFCSLVHVSDIPKPLRGRKFGMVSCDIG